MTAGVISIIIPTIAERPHWLERCKAAYQKVTRFPYEIVVVRDEPSCGRGWQKGVEYSVGDYLHLTCDDIEPREGWDIAAIETVRQGAIPAPRILNTDGTLQTCGGESYPAPAVEQPTGTPAVFTCLPFLSRNQWNGAVKKMIPLHLWTDNWVSFRCQQAGIPTLVARGYCFYHHFAPEGRRARHAERETYEAYCRGELTP